MSVARVSRVPCKIHDGGLVKTVLGSVIKTHAHALAEMKGPMDANLIRQFKNNDPAADFSDESYHVPLL